MNQKTLSPLSDAAQSLKPGSIYKHYKGLRYKILGVARHSETLEEMVIYQALYGDYGTWVRPLGMFLEKVTINGQEMLRFSPRRIKPIKIFVCLPR